MLRIRPTILARRDANLTFEHNVHVFRMFESENRCDPRQRLAGIGQQRPRSGELYVSQLLFRGSIDRLSHATFKRAARHRDLFRDVVHSCAAARISSYKVQSFHDFAVFRDVNICRLTRLNAKRQDRCRRWNVSGCFHQLCKRLGG